MQIGVIGLGRMGGNISRRLIKNGHEVVVYDHDAKAVAALSRDGAKGADGLDKLVQQLRPPRAVWVMLPAGKITEDVIGELAELLAAGDVVIDGGNTFWRDDIRRAKMLKERSIHHVDVGTSGGVWGLDRGYCMMIGGDKAIVDRPRSDFRRAGARPRQCAAHAKTRRPRSARRARLHPCRAERRRPLRQDGAQRHRIRPDAGLCRRFRHSRKTPAARSLPEDDRFDLDLADIAEVWRRGSVISSWLLDLTASALAADDKLEGFEGVVEDSGEGRWTIMAAIEEAVPADVLSAALYTRFRSRQSHTFAEKILSAMRKGFGDHVEPKAKQS